MRLKAAQRDVSQLRRPHLIVRARDQQDRSAGFLDLNSRAFDRAFVGQMVTIERCIGDRSPWFCPGEGPMLVLFS